jgi:hypothetical protein
LVPKFTKIPAREEKDKPRQYAPTATVSAWLIKIGSINNCDTKFVNCMKNMPENGKRDLKIVVFKSGFN